MRNDEVDNEAQKKNSWTQTEESLKEISRSGTNFGDSLKPLFGIIDVLRSRGFDSLFYAGQSHGRLCIKAHENPELEPSEIIVTSLGNDRVHCQLFVCKNREVILEKSIICSPPATPDAIEEYAKLLT